MGMKIELDMSPFDTVLSCSLNYGIKCSKMKTFELQCPWIKCCKDEVALLLCLSKSSSSASHLALLYLFFYFYFVK